MSHRLHPLDLNEWVGSCELEFYLKSCTMSLCYYRADPFGTSTQTLAPSWNISFLPLVWRPRRLSKPAVTLSCFCRIYTNRIYVFSIRTSLSCTYISLLLYINYLYTYPRESVLALRSDSKQVSSSWGFLSLPTSLMIPLQQFISQDEL